jgi:hypothetical protein
VYVPATLTPGTNVPKFPPVKIDGPVQVPVDCGEPPNELKRLTVLELLQRATFPLVPALEGVETFTSIEALEVQPLAAVPTTV